MTEQTQPANAGKPPRDPLALLNLTSPLAQTRLRVSDAYGQGHFGAPRGYTPSGKRRRHKGIDLMAEPYEPVFSPISGTFIRRARPYRSDDRYCGFVVRGDDGLEVKVFYVAVEPDLDRGMRVRAGLTLIGHAQDLSMRYPDKGRGPMVNHLHLEVRRGGVIVDPTEALGLGAG
ncbi:MAG: M23 family metallopeptidase [Magnetovibrionaceae bacterium]